MSGIVAIVVIALAVILGNWGSAVLRQKGIMP
jgi:hypothetical protein